MTHGTELSHGARRARAEGEAVAMPRIAGRAPTIRPGVANDNRASLAFHARRWAVRATLALLAAAVLAVGLSGLD